MYKFICLFLLVVLQGAVQKSFGQKDSTLIQKITSEFCTEFSKNDFTTLKGAEMEIGLLILPIIEKYSKEIEKEWNLSPENENDFEKISEKIGQQAALGCPKFLEFVRNNLSELSGPSDEPASKSITGTFQRIETQLFSSLVIKTKAGKEEKLWWFQFFEGSDKLTKNPSMLAKKNITIQYTEMEVYDSKLQEYRIIKVIKNLVEN